MTIGECVCVTFSTSSLPFLLISFTSLDQLVFVVVVVGGEEEEAKQKTNRKPLELVNNCIVECRQVPSSGMLMRWGGWWWNRRMLSLSFFPNAEKRVVVCQKKKSRRTFQTHCSHSWQRGSFLNEPAAFDSSSELTARKVVAIRAGWMIVPSGERKKSSKTIYYLKIQVNGIWVAPTLSVFFLTFWTISHTTFDF